MDSKELRNLYEAYNQVYQIDEISADLALKASKEADIKRGKLAHAGDKAGAAAKAAQASRLYKAQAAKRLNREEFELWVNSLVEEGYDLSDYTWDEMYEFYLGEAITSEKGKAKAAEMIAKRTTASGRAKPGQGDNVATIKHISRSNRDGLLGTPPNRKVAGSNWPKSYTGIGGTGNKAARRAAALKKEEVDIFDIVLEFLQVEGYAETLEEAEWIMANLIDDEAIEIILGESALGTMAVLGGMAAGRAIHGKLQDRKAKKEYEAKKRTSDYLIMKDRTKDAVARDRSSSGDTRKEEFEAWFDAILEARRADKEGYERGSAANPKRKDIPHGDPSQRSMLHSKLKRRADEMGRERRSSSAYKAGSRPPVSKKEKAFLQAADRTRQSIRNPNVPNTGKH
jgi:hypothetical protein